MSKRYRYLLMTLVLVVVLSSGLLAYVLRDNKVTIEQYSSIGRPPRIRPDYSGTVVPPNISPLNFLVQESGALYCVKIYSKQGKTIEVFSRTPKIVIPVRSWRELLNMNRGEELYFDIFTKTENDQWGRFDTITNKIAHEDIDDYLVYRKISPAHRNWREIGIYQRNLQNHKESLILDNRYFKFGCLNCHTFCNNRTDKMTLGIRSRNFGTSTILLQDGQASLTSIPCWLTTWLTQRL